MMKALLWKDLRLFADVFLAGVALLLGSYALAFLLVWSDDLSAFEWSKVIGGGASLTRFTSLLVCALLGACAFGRESEDRSLRFLACLPARSADVVLSKLVIAVSMVVILWLTSTAILAVAMRAMGYGWDALLWTLQAMLGYVASGVMAFGGAWLLSFLLNTSIGAAFAGLMLLAPVYAAQLLLNSFFGLDNPMFFHGGAVVFMVVAGLLGVTAGTSIYMRSGCAADGASALFGRRRPGLRTATSLDLPAHHKRNGPIRALLWKDYRLMRAPLLTGLAVLALPHAVAAAGSRISGNALSHFETASLIGIALGALIFPFWSGHIMAAESASGTVRFLSSLPVPPVKALAGKLAVSFTPMLCMSTVNVVLLIMTHNANPNEAGFNGDLTWTEWVEVPHIVMGLGLANGAAVAFSLAWFASAHYGWPALAIVFGVLAAPLVLTLWAALSTFCAETADSLSPLQFATVFSSGACVAALLLLVAGSIIALRRRG